MGLRERERKRKMRRGTEGAPDQRRQTALHGGMRCHGYRILKGSFLRETIIRPGRRGRSARCYGLMNTHTYIRFIQIGQQIRRPRDDEKSKMKEVIGVVCSVKTERSGG